MRTGTIYVVAVKNALYLNNDLIMIARTNSQYGQSNCQSNEQSNCNRVGDGQQVDNGAQKLFKNNPCNILNKIRFFKYFFSMKTFIKKQ